MTGLLMKGPKCPHCKSEMTTPTGYTMFEVVHYCNDCEQEFNTERDVEQDEYVIYLKGLF